jgi:GNAT superfamily N-acetyltransferase
VIDILAPVPGNVEDIAMLMEKLDRSYGVTNIEPRGQREPQIAAALFQEPKAAYAFLAWDWEQLVGIASYSFLWPAAGVTRSLYLKELYVIEGYRRKDVGTLLMQRLCQVAVEYGCSRVEWTTDKGNVLGESFYERLGIPQNQEKIFYRLEDDSIRQMAGSL